MHEKMYPEDEEGLNKIPKRESVSAARMNGATISHDTCSTALKHGYTLADNFTAIAKEEGIPDEEIQIHQGNCFHHLCNV